MTDRINAVVVVLEEDTRIDDAEDLLTAIRQLRGVISVTPNVATVEDHIAHGRARRELYLQLLDVVDPKKQEGLS